MGAHTVSPLLDERSLRAVGWIPLVTVAAGIGARAVSAQEVPSGVVIFIEAVLFGLWVVQPLLAAVVWPTRRPALLCLAAGVLLWGLGSLSVVGEGAHRTSFPSTGEWFFMTAYVGMAGYILFDGLKGWGTSLSTWLETVVACGGATSLAGVLLVTPVADGFARQGVPLLVALMAPFLDILLIILVTGQMVLRRRLANRATLILASGLLLILAGDMTLAARLSDGTYNYGPVTEFMWAIGFLLLVRSACRPHRHTPSPAVTRNFRGVGVMIAAGIALTVLTFQPHGQARAFVVVPACLTLLAAGGRMLGALRQARGAAEALRLSRTDDLTGLPNRRAVMAELATALADDRPVALMLLDLDGFKEINDSLGHVSGDELLTIVGERIREAQADTGFVARLGGDEYAVVLPEGDERALLRRAQAIRDVVCRPASIDDMQLSLTASVGIAVRQGPRTTSGDLLRQADVAMYQAKVRRRGAVVYDPARDEFSRRRLSLAEDLRHGIEAGELAVWYQPQVETSGQSVCAMEALVRWNHPRYGLLQPGAFLPAARRAGLMPAVTEAVTKLAVEDMRRWLCEGMHLRVAVNMAPPELLGGVVLQSLFSQARSAGLPENSLVVEVTEESFISDPDHAREVLREIWENGVQVSIDDYGTGFSSLSYLRDLPIQELKIDRSFIQAVQADSRSRLIVSTTNEMAHGLGLRTVAEGVEDEATVEELVDIGVDILQGYHLSRPMPAAQVPLWMLDHRGAGVPVG